MKYLSGLLLTLGVILTGLTAWAAGGDASRYVQDFEAMNGPGKDWSIQGDVTVDNKGFNSKKALAFKRTRENVAVPTSITMSAFPVKGGKWELEIFYQAKLYSPDSSFNGTLYLDLLDKDKKVIAKKEIRVIDGKKAWREYKRQIIIPDMAAYGQFRVKMNKTWGEFRLDNMVANYIGPAPKTIFKAVKLGPRAYGGMFYPKDSVIFDITVECTEKWTNGPSNIDILVTDYWGAEQLKPMAIKLAKDKEKPGFVTYKGVMDLAGKKLEQGKYYEVRSQVANGPKDIYKEDSSFAILPAPITKQYPPFDIPFTLNNWDDRIKDTFFMADRLGIRWKLVWSGWEAEPPYKTYAPGIEWIKELNMGALLGMRPVSGIEKSRKGSEKWTEEALKQGAKNLINQYKDYCPIMIRCGNEPHTEPEAVKKSVAAYKAVYEGAKEADPNVFFIGTSVGPCEEFFKQGFQNYCDAFDYHTYSGWKGLRTITNQYKELFKKYNCEKPIYCTEIGLNSQGMARLDVSRDMTKKFAAFFATGGANMAWFDLLYPDTKGTIQGSNAEAFNVINAKYCLYAPKITAVTYYNMVNGICIKKFVEEKIYDGEIEAILFRDKEDRCLAYLWKEQGSEDAFLPMPGIKDVKLIEIDGTIKQLNANGKGLNLTMSENPVLLFFDSSDFKFADELQKPQVAIVGSIPTIIKGSETNLSFKLNGASAADLSLRVPPFWEAKQTGNSSDTATFAVKAPERTEATTGMLSLQSKQGNTELSIPMPVAGKLALRVVPAPYKNGTPGIKVCIINNGSTPEKVKYHIAIPEEIHMEKGTFHKSHAKPFSPVVKGKLEGEATIQGRAQQEIVLPIANIDPKCIYKARVNIVDADGERVEAERFISGFTGVPKVKSPLKLDLAADKTEWERALPLMINEEKQYYWLRRDSEEGKWDSPEDLSGVLRFLWDDKYLYLRCDVVDDKYCHNKKNGHLWAMDGLQMLVDPSRESSEKSGYYDISMGNGAKGNQAWCHSSAHPSVLAGPAKGIVVKTFPSNKSKGGRTYVVAIPWAHLAPFKPIKGNNIGLAVIINEDDGPGRGSFMGWFGCAHSKQLDLVGDLILE